MFNCFPLHSLWFLHPNKGKFRLKNTWVVLFIGFLFIRKCCALTVHVKAERSRGGNVWSRVHCGLVLSRRCCQHFVLPCQSWQLALCTDPRIPPSFASKRLPPPVEMKGWNGRRGSSHRRKPPNGIWSCRCDWKCEFPFSSSLMWKWRSSAKEHFRLNDYK